MQRKPLLAPLTLLAGLFLVGACAPPGASRPATRSGDNSRPTASAHGEIPMWRLADLAQAQQPTVLLRSPAGPAARFDSARMRLMYDVALKVVGAAGGAETPEWMLIGTPTVNAYASYENGRPVIGITLGMVNLLGDDAGAWAALVGHELAHFRLGHHQSQRSRKEAVEIGSSLAGLVLSAAGLGFGSFAADATGTLVDRSFSRDAERDADRAGLDYARRAGLDPQGALRLQERLQGLQRDATFGFLSTHPSGSERVETLRQLLEEAAAADTAPAADTPHRTPPQDRAAPTPGAAEH